MNKPKNQENTKQTPSRSSGSNSNDADKPIPSPTPEIVPNRGSEIDTQKPDEFAPPVQTPEITPSNPGYASQPGEGQESDQNSGTDNSPKQK